MSSHEEQRVQAIIDQLKDLTKPEKEQLELSLVLREDTAHSMDLLQSLLRINLSLNTLWGRAICDKRELEILAAKLLDLCKLQCERLDSRDRKSAPATMKQDEEIHSLRTGAPKTWSWGKLARKFDMTKRGAEKAFERHAKRIEDDAHIRHWEQRLARMDLPTTRVLIELVEELIQQSQQH